MSKITKDTLVQLSLIIESVYGDFIDDSKDLMYLHGGYNQIFQKLEESLESKQLGDTFNITLQPKDACGEFDESLVLKESLENLPNDLEIGMELDVEGEEEQKANIWIVEKIEDGYATLNANHELAGVPLVISGVILKLEHLPPEGVEKVLSISDEHIH